jgi:flagellar basal body-associated protein FliL
VFGEINHKRKKNPRKTKKKMSEPDTSSESNNIVFIIVIGIVFICIIGFVYYRLRNRSSPKQAKVTNETPPIKAQQSEDPLKNCRVFSTNHGLRIYECNEKGDPITKISQPVLKTSD